MCRRAGRVRRWGFRRVGEGGRGQRGGRWTLRWPGGHVRRGRTQGALRRRLHRHRAYLRTHAAQARGPGATTATFTVHCLYSTSVGFGSCSSCACRHSKYQTSLLKIWSEYHTNYCAFCIRIQWFRILYSYILVCCTRQIYTLQSGPNQLRSTETEVYVATAHKGLVEQRLSYATLLWDAGFKVCDLPNVVQNVQIVICTLQYSTAVFDSLLQVLYTY